MTDATVEELDAPKKSSKLPLILGLTLAVAGAAAGFFGVTTFLGESAESADAPKEDHTPDPLPDVSFVAMEPLVISLLDDRLSSHLRFRAQLEVDSKYQSDVEKMLPRVVDVLNGYLRALEPEELRDPMALTKLRAQMLRRVQVVTGAGRVRDLLIMEFVLN